VDYFIIISAAAHREYSLITLAPLIVTKGRANRDITALGDTVIWRGMYTGDSVRDALNVQQ
jgi:hypothetical protein